MGCMLKGSVVDEVTGKPAAGVIVTAQGNTPELQDAMTISDGQGRYRLPVVDGNYNVFAESADRVCSNAVTNQIAMEGQSVDLPPLKLTEGGWIVGRVMNTKTGQPVG